VNEASPLSITQLKPELCWHPMEPCLQHCGHHRFMQLCPHCLVCSLAFMLALVHKLQGCCRRHCTWPDVHPYLLDGCTVYRLLLAQLQALASFFQVHIQVLPCCLCESGLRRWCALCCNAMCACLVSGCMPGSLDFPLPCSHACSLCRYWEIALSMPGMLA
jgi:hypothetical protein